MPRSGVQLLAYEMEFAAAGEVAMILPIPTPPRSAENGVRFISLERYPRLFDELRIAFQYPDGFPRGRPQSRAAPASILAVHAVGAFVASFVPSLADFARLDPRFQMAPGTIDRVPAYADYGFVVFQLGATGGRVRAHPMAFEFPTRDPDRLFFPLVHVHDGTLHSEADFDHVLYAQGLSDNRMFERSKYAAKNTVDHHLGPLVLDLDGKLSRRTLVGRGPNHDEWALIV